MNGYRFDPLLETPRLPPGLRYESGPWDEPRYHIVQLKDRVDETMKQALEAAGVAILHYVPDDAFVVRADRAAMQRVRRLSTVRWTGVFEPAFKLSRRLAVEYDAVVEKALKMDGPAAAAGGAPRVDTSLRIAVHIVTMEESNLAEVGRSVRAQGGSGVATFPGNSGLVTAEVPRAALERLAREPGVLWIDRATPAWAFNDSARWVIQSNDEVNFSTPIHDHGIFGTGETVTIGDTGIDIEHDAFQDPAHPTDGFDHRKVTAYYIPPNAVGDHQDNGVFNHGTHVSGTVAGDDAQPGVYDGDPDASSGAQGPHDGQAFDARIHVQDFFQEGGIFFHPPDDTHDMFQAALDPSHYAPNTPQEAFSWIHTNSWGGCCAGYPAFAAGTDDFVWDNPDFLVLFAAGNFGTQPQFISPWALSKNAIAVGATRNGAFADDLAVFSSRGPAADGRIKPDLTAPGVAIWSARGCDGQSGCAEDQYWQLSGTSMSTPTVAGAAALVREYFRQGFYPSGTAQPASHLVPSAALMKAILINSAHEMNGEGAYANGELKYPNNQQGWGRILLDDALYFRGDARRLVIDDHRQGLAVNDTVNYQFFVSAPDPVEVTLVWSDFPGEPDSEPNLVNDLNLIVTAPDGRTFHGNQFEGHDPGESKVNPTELDDLNNVENVLVLSNVTQGTWNVSVSAFRVGMGGTQPYAIVMTGVLASPSGSIRLDKDAYRSTAIANVEVVDSDLNQNPGVAESVTVRLSSTFETTPETVVLNETGPSTARFTGSIPLASGPAPIPGDHHLQVQSPDVITAAYFDADDGHGGSGDVQATATIDDDPPAITNLQISHVTSTHATITWTTNEPADSLVRFGNRLPPASAASETALTKAHRIVLEGLQPATTHYFSVESTDRLGNLAIADNGGSYFQFDTPATPLPGSEWTTFQNGTERRGFSPSHFLPPLQEDWISAASVARSVPVGPVISEGTVYATNPDGLIQAFDAQTGELIWERRPWGGAQGGQPTVVDGVVYGTFCASDGSCILTAREAETGDLIWSRGASENGGFWLNSAILVVTGGKVICRQSNTSMLYAFDTGDGHTLWQQSASFESPLASAAGEILFGTSVGIQSLSEEDGSPLWNVPLGWVSGAPVYANGIWYVGTEGGVLYALNAVSHAIEWQTEPIFNTVFSSIVFEGSTLYVGAWGSGGGYYAFDPADGSLLWQVPLPVGAEGGVAYAHGHLYSVARDGVLRVIDVGTHQVVDSKPLFSAYGLTRSSPAISNSRVYVTDDSGVTRAFQGVPVDTDADGDPDDFDCAPANPAIHHGAIEVCNGLDDNCLNGVDDGFDADFDTYTTCGGDCNDSNPQIHPGAAEICNGLDDNCQNGVDEGFDLDGDTYTTCGGDCDDSRSFVHPGAVEGPADLTTCFDGLDDDCDQVTDLDCSIDVASGGQSVIDGSVTSGSVTSLATLSSDDSYEDLLEAGGLPAKLTAIWTFNPATTPVGITYDLKVEGNRPTASPNDNFLFSYIVPTTTPCSPSDSRWASASTLLTLTKIADDDQPQTAALGASAATFCVRVLDSNRATSGPSKDLTADTLRLDRLFLFPTPVAANDYPAGADRGILVFGYFRDTQSSNEAWEGFRETGSRLVRTWKFTGVPSGSSHKLHLEGNRNCIGQSCVLDDYNFYWSTDPSTWSPVNPLTGFTAISGATINTIIDVAGGADHGFPAASFPGGTVYIRVIDAQKKNTGSSTGTLNIDHMAIKTVP